MSNNKLKIIITDSGFGGLSVHAKLDRTLKKLKNIGDIELVFFNSYAGIGYGYNELNDIEEKLKVFNSALTGITKLKPDIILIACNTLSILYPKTIYSKESKIPVLGIVNSGVEQVLESVNISDNYFIIIFGTETTINSKIYQNMIVEQGFSNEKIIAQGCKNLESEIQINPSGEKVKELITKYVNKVAERIQDKRFEKIVLVLACTHYGFSEKIFKEKLKNKFNQDIIILNPNEKIVNKTLNFITSEKRIGTKITNKVYSKNEYSEEQIRSLADLIEKDSPSLREALLKINYSANLFGV